jgi:bisanhydrobacterioruberin hydratase
MIQHSFQRLALFLFWIYLAIFPGSTIVVALDRVPGWGGWMGGALLLLQGAVALCWLLGAYGARGGAAGRSSMWV